MANFENLRIWQKSHALMTVIHKITQTLPKEERFCVKDQIQRSSSSIGANIAEGYNSYYYKDKIKTFYIARKEAAETQNHIRYLQAKKYISPELSQQYINEYQELIKGINAYIQYIRKKSSQSPPDPPIP